MSAVTDTFETDHKKGITRREALRAVFVGGASAAVATSLPFGNDAQAEQNTGLLRREMRHFSQDPNTRGIGIFINLQRDGTIAQGQQLGDLIADAFEARGIPVEYRINQSRGTATDLTFYVGGYDFTIGLPDIRAELPNVLAHHQDIWVHGRSATLSSLPQ